MKIQFLNNISLHLISGGNIYNNAVIDGLRQNNIAIDYNITPLDKDYDISIIDSLFMNEINLNHLDKNKPIVALIHQQPILNTTTLDFYKTYSKFIVTGEPTKKALINLWQVNENNITIIRPGLTQHWKPKTIFKDQPKNISIVSNFIENKGFEMLIKILKHTSHLDLKFDIVGNNKLDETYANHIIKSIKEVNANISFHFNLNNDEVYNQLINSDLFLSLSTSESFGMAIFEALNLGLPCLTYKTGDFNYFSTYSNYIALDDYSEYNFSKIIEEWVNNPIPYKKYCNTKPKNKRHWNQVVDEFSAYLKNTVIC